MSKRLYNDAFEMAAASMQEEASAATAEQEESSVASEEDVSSSSSSSSSYRNGNVEESDDDNTDDTNDDDDDDDDDDNNNGDFDEEEEEGYSSFYVLARQQQLIHFARRIIFRLDKFRSYWEISPALHIIRCGEESSAFNVPNSLDMTAFSQQKVDSQKTKATTCQQKTHFSSLAQSLRLSILQFLDLPTIVAVRQVNRTCRHLLRNDSLEALNMIWKPMWERQWPWLRGKQVTAVHDSRRRRRRQDDVSFKTTTLDYARVLGDLAYAGDAMCNAVDSSLFPQDIIQYKDDDDDDDSNQQGDTTIAFLGIVGPQNRCIRGNAALPLAPEIKVRLPCKSTYKSIHEWRPHVWERKPFVVPYALDASTFSLEPRLVSYFEVQVLSDPSSSSRALEHGNLVGRRNSLQRLQEIERVPDEMNCVAIGIGTKRFPYKTHMPGWTPDSFGYHGDDGGSFEGANFVEEPRIFETFGAGDCVGCGINYENGTLFYCKNGQFLFSVGLYESDLAREWFPLVGIDSSWPVKVNFGHKPFRFDLTRLVQSQRERVANVLWRGSNCQQESHCFQDELRLLSQRRKRLAWLHLSE